MATESRTGLRGMFFGGQIKRYGRTLSIVTGRLGIPWGLHIYARPWPASLLLGIHAYQDEDGDHEVCIGIGVLMLTIRPMKYLTRKALAQRRDELADLLAPRLVDEIEEHLRG